MAVRRLYLVAAAGYPNYGDELITAQWLRYLAQHEPEAEIWVDCHNPGGAALLFRDLHPNLHFVDTVWQLGWAAPSDDPEEVVGVQDQVILLIQRDTGAGVPGEDHQISLV